jgi:hypothetical protein
MVVKRVLEKLNKRDWRYHKATMQVHTEVRGFAKTLKENFWTLSISTFGIATALIWYEVVKQVIDEFFPQRNTLGIKLFVAIVVTLVSITGTYIISRLRSNNGMSK